MKILIVSSFLPYPLFSGGHVRLFNLVKLLGKRHEITLICEKRSYQTEQDIKTVEKICKKVVVVERKKQWQLSNILRAGFSFYPFLLVGHDNAILKKEIEILLSTNTFDVIHVETFYVMQNLPKNVSIPVVLVEHNIEYLVYERYVKQAPFFIRPLLAIDIAKLQYWERLFWRRAAKLVAVSEQEKRLMDRDDVEIVPNGVDVEKFKIQNTKFKSINREKRILFIGDFKWMQNCDSVEWILKEIWPSFVSRFARTTAGKPKIKLWIVGRKIPQSIRKLTIDPDVIFDENAPKDTEKIFDQADILLAPIRVGGGTSYKILEAMASGVPVVTTSLGIEGIDARNNDDVLIADSTEGLASKTIELLEDQEKYLRLVKNARILIEKKYDWKIIVKQLEKIYESAC